MKERIVEIETPDGRMDTFITHPEQGGPFPPVILFMDVWGVCEQLFDLARRIGTVGYTAVVPNFYYRKGGISFDFRQPDGKTISLSALDKAKQEEILGFLSHLTDDFAVSDTGAVLKFLADDDAVRPGPAGSVGYCLGGVWSFVPPEPFPKPSAPAPACTAPAWSRMHPIHRIWMRRK